MNSKFTNFTVALVALTVVSLAEKIASVIKVGMAGYPPVAPPRVDIVARGGETPGKEIEAAEDTVPED